MFVRERRDQIEWWCLTLSFLTVFANVFPNNGSKTFFEVLCICLMLGGLIFLLLAVVYEVRSRNKDAAGPALWVEIEKYARDIVPYEAMDSFKVLVERGSTAITTDKSPNDELAVDMGDVGIGIEIDDDDVVSAVYPMGPNDKSYVTAQ